MSLILLIGLIASILTVITFIFGMPYLKDYIIKLKKLLNKEVVNNNDQYKEKPQVKQTFDPVLNDIEVETIQVIPQSECTLKKSEWKGVMNSNMFVQGGHEITNTGQINGNVTISVNSIFINYGLVNGRVINLGGEFINLGMLNG